MRWALAALAAVSALVAALVAWSRVRDRRAEWWGRAERVCTCGNATRRALGRLAQVADGGLAEVAAAQRDLLQSDCDDLRLAVSRRTWADELRERPLRVTATDRQHELAGRVTAAIGVMCGARHAEFWQRLGDDLAAHARDSVPDDLAVVRTLARGHLAIRQGMCADRARLTVPPRSYEISAADAERQAAECQREVASSRR